MVCLVNHKREQVCYCYLFKKLHQHLPEGMEESCENINHNNQFRLGCELINPSRLL
jgi:hypothetical protein